MHSGQDHPQYDRSAVHKQAMLTAATAVFMNDLCKDMIALHLATGDADMRGIAQSCAGRLLLGHKFVQIENMLTRIIEHPDGMPDLGESALLAEVMACYSEAARAERIGEARVCRRDKLIPAIGQAATECDPMSDEQAIAFVTSINAANTVWESYEPTTPFQQIVCDAISTFSI